MFDKLNKELYSYINQTITNLKFQKYNKKIIKKK